MSNLYPFAKVLWSLTSSGAGTTLSAAGNSGSWGGAGAGDIYPEVSQETAIDLRDATDVALMIAVAGITGTPVFEVSLDGYDDLGNLYAGLLKQSSGMTLTSLPAAAILAGGLHGGSASSYLVLPRWGRVSWTLTGGTVTGTEIALYGR